MTPVRETVFIVDDDASVREALANLMRSVGLHAQLFASAQEFLKTPRPDSPACLILDVRMPGLGGLDCQRQLADAGCHIPIIFMTGHGDIPMSVQAMKAGAVDFLAKPFRDLNKQIAGELGTSEITVKVHRGHVMRKMQADSVADLVRMAGRLGVTPRS